MRTSARMSPIFIKVTSILLAVIFIAGQVSAGQISSSRPADTLAASVVSDPAINPARSGVVRNDIAGKAEPGAIGNGTPLMELVQGKLPDQIGLSDQTVIDKVRESIGIAIKLHIQNRQNIPPQHKLRSEQALANLITLQDHLTARLHLYNAVVNGPEDYLVGFNFQEKIGLSVELIDMLYKSSPRCLAQYIYHECVPEKGMVLQRDDHRLIYRELQSAVFGEDEVKALGQYIRYYIDVLSVMPQEGVKALEQIIEILPSFKAIAFDFDGTLTLDRTKISEPVIARAIIKILALGIDVIIVTGQRDDEIEKHFVAELKKYPEFKDEYLSKIHLYVFGGSLGYNAAEGPAKPYYRIAFDDALIGSFRAFCEEQGWNPGTRELYFGGPLMTVRHLNSPSHATALADAEKVKVWAKANGFDVNIVAGSLTCMITPKGASKQVAVDDIQKRFKFSHNDFIKVGDMGSKDGNDYDLLRWPNSFTVDRFDAENPFQTRVSEILKHKGPKAAAVLLNLLINKLQRRQTAEELSPTPGKTEPVRDLHAHSYYSDGAYSPDELCRQASEEGVSELALTDHDTIEGLEEASRAARDYGIRFIPGIELTAQFGNKTVHILGYGFDPERARRDKNLMGYLGEVKERDHVWAREMCKKSEKDPIVVTTDDGQKHSITVSAEEIEEFRGTIPSTFHVALIISRKLAKISQGLAIPARHVHYLLFRRPEPNRNKESYDPKIVERYKDLMEKYKIEIPPTGYWWTARSAEKFMSAETAINAIIGIGGIPVLAHPGEQRLTAEDVEKIARMGIRGIEIHTYKHKPEERQIYGAVASKYGLFVTSGTDYHDEFHRARVRLGKDRFGEVLTKGVSAKGLKQEGAYVYDNLPELSKLSLSYRAELFKADLIRVLSEHPDRLFFIGIETDIGESQKAQVMPLYKAVDQIENLTDAGGKRLFPNLMVRRSSAAELTATISGLDKDKKLDLNNVFIGARKASVEGALYDSIKGEGRAWISAIDDSKPGDYLPVFEAITLNMMAYLNADLAAMKNFYDAISDKPVDPGVLQDMIRNRIMYILPRATKFDTRQLRQLYELAQQVYLAA